jgi:hypothetical protein
LGSGGVGGWAAASVVRWPKFWPKSSKGAGEKKKLAGRICGRKLAELFPEFAKHFSCTGQKIILGPGNTGNRIHMATAEHCPLH